MKKTHVLLAAATIIGGVVLGLAASGTADKPDRGPKPPKAAINQVRSQLERPDPLDPDSIAGQPRQDAPGFALILRDPETGKVLREPNGLPMVAKNPDGSTKLFTPLNVPEDQKAAQAKNEERAARAKAGDAKAKAELDDEARKTNEAIEKTKPK
jgi:hypothetical protein